MAKELGKLVVLDVQVGDNWVTIGATQDHNLDITNDLLEVTTKDSGKWKEFVEIFKEMDISLNGLHDPTEDHGPEEIIDTILAGNGYKIRYGIKEGGAYYLEANVLIESYSEGAPHDGLRTFDLSLKANGAPEKKTADWS